MASENGKRKVFISYSRKDGTSAAHALRDALVEAGCEVWLDTERIRGGVSWTRETEDALNGCDVLVAVLTEASFVSEICRAEQIWARDKRKTIFPVLVGTDDVVPLYFRDKQRRKYPSELAEINADVTGELQRPEPMDRPLRYDTIPSYPQSYIVREEPLAKLRDLVFTEDSGTNIAVTAVAGMGGVGKTVLATALCRDSAVQRAFPDGIAWITIGREWDGDFVSRMREVGRALGEDVEHGWDNKLACENRYKTVLREKAALVVVDDVWNVEHLKPLLVDAPRSRFLFSTRDGGIAKAVAHRRYSANVLNEAEARSLLAQRAEIAESALSAEASAILRECGYLALAISQIGAALRDVPAVEWRDTLEALKAADIGAIELLTSGQESFYKSLAVSIQAIPEQMQQRYLKLAVLLEDVPAPLVILRTLWKASEGEARRTARYFVERSLATWQDDADTALGIKLHDLQLDYVRAKCQDQRALQLIHEAMRLSAHVIRHEPEAFAPQMVGRLLTHERISTVSEFTKEVAEGAPKPWLRPLWPALEPPGTALIRTLAGHSDEVHGVAVTADGRRAVSASEDNTLKVWDLESGAELRTLAGHSAHLWELAVTADGRHAVSASDDHTVKVWDLENGHELRTLGAHSDSVLGVAVTQDGRRAVSASRDKTLRLWDLDSGASIASFTCEHSATCCAFAGPEKIFAADEGGRLYLLKIEE